MLKPKGLKAIFFKNNHLAQFGVWVNRTSVLLLKVWLNPQPYKKAIYSKLIKKFNYQNL